MKTNLMLFLIFLSSLINANPLINQDGCKTKLKQIMKAEYPLTDHQGYAVLGFNINKDGELENTRIIESMCVTKRNLEGNIEFRKCPFFKNKSLMAAKYIKYLPPKNNLNESCSIKEHKYRYDYSIYNNSIVDNNFVLRSEFFSK